VGPPANLATAFGGGAVGPPARFAATFGGGRGRISTLRPFNRLRASSAVHRYVSAQALPSAGELVLSFRRRASSFLAPFGAALGNPEVTGRQTVRARAKKTSFPNGNLAGRGICPGVFGWTRISKSLHPQFLEYSNSIILKAGALPRPGCFHPGSIVRVCHY
jgi:hypothetical protein